MPDWYASLLWCHCNIDAEKAATGEQIVTKPWLLKSTKLKKSYQHEIEYVAKKMNMTDDEVARVSDEWKVLSLAASIGCPSQEKRVDYYWRDLFDIKQSNGKPKNPS